MIKNHPFPTPLPCLAGIRATSFPHQTKWKSALPSHAKKTQWHIRQTLLRYLLTVAGAAHVGKKIASCFPFNHELRIRKHQSDTILQADTEKKQLFRIKQLKNI